MFKHKLKLHQISVTNYIVISSIFLVFLYNIPNFIIKVQLNHSHHMVYFKAITVTLAEVCLALAVLILFLGIVSFSRILLKFFILTFIILSSVFAYYVFTYKIFIDEMLIDTILKTNQAEIGNVLSIYFFVYLLLFTVVPSFIFIYVIRIQPYLRVTSFFKHFSKTLAIVFGFLILVGGLNYKLYVNNMLFNKHFQYAKYTTKSSLSFYMPLNYVAAIFQYAKGIYVFKYNNTKNIAEEYPFKLPTSLANTSMNIILVIGESARADHQSLNGYKRDTNPNLEKVKNLVTYPNVSSCNTYSVGAINCLLSYKSRGEFKINLQESNLVSVFNTLGFASYFLSTQSIYNDFNYMYFPFKDIQTKIFNNKIRKEVPTGSYLYDAYLLPFLKDIANNKNNPHKLIIIYLTGSHMPYNTRYPNKFRVFKGKDNNLDSYDNTVLYTDYILSKIIEKYRKQRTFLYYVSD
ncbi:putative phosphatidylethanolamine transferase Mcr-1, partial [Candidatus Hepatincola sp. Pdp]